MAKFQQGRGCPLSNEAYDALVLATRESYLRRISGQDMPGPEEFFDAVKRLDKLQKGKERELEEIAVELVREEFGIGEGDLSFDAKLVRQIRIINGGNESKIDDTAGVESGVNPTLLEDEIAKRRVINSLIQGCAHRTQWRFILERERLNQIADGLSQASEQLMLSADSSLWLVDESRFHTDNRALSSPGIIGGAVSLDLTTTPVTVIARAIHFPILVHELAKGVMEVIALHGLPEKDKRESKLRQLVLREADKPEFEWNDIRTGAALYSKIMSHFPTQNLTQRNRFFKRLFELPARKLVSMMEELAKGNPELLNNFIEQFFAID